MRVAVLGNPGSWYGADLARAAAERGHVCTRIDFRRLAAAVGMGESSAVSADEAALSDHDAVIVRTMPPGSLEQVVYRMDALASLESAGATVLNPPKAIECAVDKYLCTSRLDAAGLPVPPTVVCEDAASALAAFGDLGGDVLVKPLFGAEGRGIVRVSDPELALRTFRTLERIHSVLYLQKFLEHEGFDIRLMVLDGAVMGAMRRQNAGDFRTNVSNGGTASRYSPTSDEEELALRASAAAGTRMAGVDLLYDRSGECYVIEVNAVPGWRAFGKVTGCDVAARVIESLERGKVSSG